MNRTLHALRFPVVFLSAAIAIVACATESTDGPDPSSGDADAGDGDAARDATSGRRLDATSPRDGEILGPKEAGADAAHTDAEADAALTDAGADAARSDGDADAAPIDAASADGAGDAGDGGASTIFSVDVATLARFEFNGDALDSSGHGRSGTALGTPTFVPAKFGSSLVLGGDPQGIDWSAYAATLTFPFTIEVVYISSSSSLGYQKIFGPVDTTDDGWYQLNGMFQAFPATTPAVGLLPANALHYIAFVATSTTLMDVWIDGALAGGSAMQFTAPPVGAFFFRDDSSTARNERLNGTVDALRISSVARTSAQIAATWAIVNH